ncbi:hypothetical protein, conserved [Leishmania tarentolae]|uniref:Leucine-rich repeat protein n=1 Tax=Leishmania tarentolae TaxID=5689 RepID=A0A640KLZ2_LEITA|nr:hypothetical protein, conserved [Leishmania tarentolae]
MAEHPQSFFAQAVSPSTPAASPHNPAGGDDAPASAAPPQLGVRAVGKCATSSSGTPLPRIHDKAWLFHTVLLSSIRKSSLRRDGSGRQQGPDDAQSNVAALLTPKDVKQVRSPESRERTSTPAPVDPPPTFLMAPNHLFFEDTTSTSGSGATLAERYSLRTLYASRCVSLGMRHPFDLLLEQLPSEVGQGAADQLRMLVARDTYIPAKACQALTVLLPYCTRIEYIDLSNAGLRSKSGFMTGVNTLLDALNCAAASSGIGAALHTIDLSWNELNDHTGRRLVRLVQRQPQLRVVNIEGTNISGKVQARIAEELRRKSATGIPPIVLDEADEESIAAANTAQLAAIPDFASEAGMASMLRGTDSDGL